MRILLTNDDGYNVEGILLLREELRRYGEVILVAPKVVQSAKSCAITIGPLNIEKVDELTYAVEGTPIDCVLFGLCNFEGIDLIVSGCNNSPNMGVDTIYSGTCAACTQALIANKPAISFSCAGKDYFSQITKFSKYALDYIFDNLNYSDTLDSDELLFSFANFNANNERYLVRSQIIYIIYYDDGCTEEYTFENIYTLTTDGEIWHTRLNLNGDENQS